MISLKKKRKILLTLKSSPRNLRVIRKRTTRGVRTQRRKRQARLS
jgi:hypothetical protein